MTAHAIQRAQERYGLALTFEDIGALAASMANGDGLLMIQRPDGTEVRAVVVKGTAAQVVFRPPSTVLTFLPPAGRDPNQAERIRRYKNVGNKRRRGAA